MPIRDLIIDEILGSKWYQDLAHYQKLDFNLYILSHKDLLEAYKKSLSSR